MTIHPLTIIYLLWAIYYHNTFYLAFLLFALLHELGHYLVACYYQFSVEKMMILPFGAFLSLKDFGKHQVKEEILMLIAGPLVNVIFIVCFALCQCQSLLMINVFICLFNLLPIYPLDGSKLLLLGLSYFVDYRGCFAWQIRVSIFFITWLLIKDHGLGRVMVLFYLFYQNVLYLKNYRFILMETIMADCFKYKNVKINDSLTYYRPYQNFYLLNSQLYNLENVKIALIKQEINDF